MKKINILSSIMAVLALIFQIFLDQKEITIVLLWIVILLIKFNKNEK